MVIKKLFSTTVTIQIDESCINFVGDICWDDTLSCRKKRAEIHKAFNINQCSSFAYLVLYISKTSQFTLQVVMNAQSLGQLISFVIFMRNELKLRIVIVIFPF